MARLRATPLAMSWSLKISPGRILFLAIDAAAYIPARPIILTAETVYDLDLAEARRRFFITPIVLIVLHRRISMAKKPFRVARGTSNTSNRIRPRRSLIDFVRRRIPTCGALRSRSKEVFARRYGENPVTHFRLPKARKSQENLVGVRGPRSRLFHAEAGNSNRAPTSIATLGYSLRSRWRVKSICVLFFSIWRAATSRAVSVYETTWPYARSSFQDLDAAAGGKANYLFSRAT